MTTYTLTAWYKLKGEEEWRTHVEHFESDCMDEVRSKKPTMPEGVEYAHNVNIKEYGVAPSPFIAANRTPKRKNTNAWQPKRYSK